MVIVVVVVVVAVAMAVFVLCFISATSAVLCVSGGTVLESVSEHPPDVSCPVVEFTPIGSHFRDCNPPPGANLLLLV